MGQSNREIPDMKDKVFLTLTGLFFLLFFGSLGTLALQQAGSPILRAKGSNPSSLKSFAIAFPQVAKTGDQLKVTVTIRDVNGDVMPNRSVQLAADSTITITPSDTQTTNQSGQAQFLVSSDTPGKVTLTATDVGSNAKIANIPTIEFTPE